MCHTLPFIGVREYPKEKGAILSAIKGVSEKP